MNRITRIDHQDDGTTVLHVDLPAFEWMMKRALHNASLYLAYAVQSTKNPPLQSMRLEGPLEFCIDDLPDPIPDDEKAKYQQQFLDWAIGQALIELDQSYQRYLVTALNTIADCEHYLATRTLPAPKTMLENTWTLHERFFDGVDRTEAELAFSGYLRSLGNGRNCLVS